MQALILAAGRGSRLGKKGFGRPKCLLELGRRPLIEYSLETLAEAGVAPVALVIGYCADEIRAVVGIRAEYVENPKWQVTNSLYSLLLAREWVRGDVLVLNSDILIDPEVVDRLLRVHGDAFAYDSSSGDAREHMKVKIADGLLVDMSKELPAAESSGENVGVLKFTASTASALFEIAEEQIANGGDQNWVGSAVRVLSKRHKIRGVDIAGLPWGEIDSSFDLDRARRTVLPAIERGRRRRTPVGRFIRWAVVASVVMLFGLVAAKAFKAEPVITWDGVDIEGATSVKIEAGERTSRWWVLPTGTDAVGDVSGPAQVRIDSRLVFPEDVDDTLPYVLEVRLDDERVDWFKHSAPPSATWQHPDDRPLGRRNRIEWDIPDGAHKIQVQLIAGGSESVLLRIRQTTEAD